MHSHCGYSEADYPLTLLSYTFAGRVHYQLKLLTLIPLISLLKDRMSRESSLPADSLSSLSPQNMCKQDSLCPDCLKFAFLLSLLSVSNSVFDLLTQMTTDLLKCDSFP